MRTRSLFTFAGLLVCLFVETGLANDEGPILTRDLRNVRDWTVRVEIQLRPKLTKHPILGRQLYIPKTAEIRFDRARFVFPILAESASHETYLGRLTSTARIRGADVVTGTVHVDEIYEDERRVDIALGAVRMQDHITYTVEYPMTCYETRIDERRARSRDWPSEEWPADALPYLQKQDAIDHTSPDVTALVERWTNGKPKRAKPYVLAKFLAGKVMEHYMPTEDTYREMGESLSGRLIERQDRSGFLVRGAAEAAREGKGPKNDLANLLVAVYRAAGIPARLVVGLDPVTTDRQDLPVTRAWVEFYLYHEESGRGEWIPVDIQKQREFSSRAPALDREWKFFGRNETFDMMVPIAARWTPGIEFLSPHSGPAFYGWETIPGPQMVLQRLRIRAFETPVRKGQEELEKRKERSRATSSNRE